jgi:hypothetical protein
MSGSTTKRGSNRVNGLVQRLLDAPLPEYQHVQTVKIGQQSHMLLRELARVTGRTKTELAAELLQAAIEDAVQALPNEKGTGSATEFGLRDEVEAFAQVSYQQYLQERHELVDDAVDQAADEVQNG